MNQTYQNPLFTMLTRCPDASAAVKGSDKAPALDGMVSFYQTPGGVLVVADLKGLPDPDTKCSHSIHALHIHEGGSCTGTPEKPFADAGTHYNPDGCSHPQHAGDLPPLFSNHGHAWLAVLTDRFTTDEIIGKTVIIHSGADDFTTQPSGNAGDMIACGVIRKTN